MRHARQRQRGITFMGAVLFILAIIAAVTLLVKLGPHYMQYYTIRSVMNDIRDNPSEAGKGRYQVLSNLDRRLYINEVRSLGSKDFQYQRTESGYDLSVSYQVQEHLIANMDILISFSYRVQVEQT